MKTAFVSGIFLAALMPVHVPLEPAVATEPTALCDNLILHEPIVVYELSGSTIATQVGRTLTVYGDGAMKLSATSVTGAGKCASAQTTPEVALALQRQLAQAGAFLLCDDPRLVADLPLHTLTILRGTQDARAHTFSYWAGDEDYLEVDATLEKFILDQFPKF